MIEVALIGLVRAYQLTLSPMLGGACRHEPTCSRYAVQVLRDHGAARGSALAIWRVLRCHAANPGGFDPAPFDAAPFDAVGSAR